MRHILILVVLTLLSGGIALPTSAKQAVGIHSADEVRDLGNVGDKQYVSTVSEEDFALIAQGLMGETFWRLLSYFLTGKPEYDEEAIREGLFYLPQKYHDNPTGMVTLDADVEIVSFDGRLLLEGVFKVLKFYNKKALVTYDCSPMCLPDYLVEDNTLKFRVLDTVTGALDAGGFALVNRLGCGQSSWQDGSSSSISVVDNQLMIYLHDRCGKYKLIYDWTKDSNSKPTMVKGAYFKDTASLKWR